MDHFYTFSLGPKLECQKMLSVLEYDTWETVNAAYFLSLLESKEEDNLILAEGPHLIWAPRAQGMTRPKAADFLVYIKTLSCWLFWIVRYTRRGLFLNMARTLNWYPSLLHTLQGCSIKTRTNCSDEKVNGVWCAWEITASIDTTRWSHTDGIPKRPTRMVVMRRLELEVAQILRWAVSTSDGPSDNHWLNQCTILHNEKQQLYTVCWFCILQIFNCIHPYLISDAVNSSELCQQVLARAICFTNMW